MNVSQSRIVHSVLILLLILSGPSLMAQRIGTSPVFLEPATVLADSDVRFPQVVSFGETLYLFYQRIVSDGDERTQTIAYRTSIRGSRWSNEQSLISGIPLATEAPPPIYSLARNVDELSVAISITGERTQVFTRSLYRSSWLSEFITNSGMELISPKLFATSRGLIFFASQRTSRTPFGSSSAQEYRSIVYSFRPKDSTFSTPRILPVPDDQSQISNPYLLESKGKLYVAYESRSFSIDIGISTHIHIMSTGDQGETWSAPVLATDFVDLEDRSQFTISPENYINQNPRLYEDSDGRILLLVDRNRQGRNIRVSLSRLDESGQVERFQNRDNEYISADSRSSSAAELFIHEGRKYVLYYFDVIGESQVYLAWEGTRGWVSERLSTGGGVQFLPGVVGQGGKWHFFWLQRSNLNTQVSTLIYRQPDQFVDAPIAQPLNYTLGEAANNMEVAYTITLPDDPAGLRSIRYAWSQKNRVSDSEFINAGLANTISLRADAHGQWNLFLQAMDRAGNSSKHSRISYDLDLVPPEQVRFGSMPLDEDGYIISNTVDLPWITNREPDLAGYRIRLRYLGNADEEIGNAQERISSLSAGILADSPPVQEENVLRLNNADDGLWALFVTAVDRVGNEGEAGVEFIRLNKYIPVTRLDLVDLQENILGDYVLSFNGRGYLANGIVSSIIFDLDGQEPWDHELLLSNEDYQISSDRLISRINLTGLRTGDYLIGINHSGRGLYIHPQRLNFETNGAVKLGDYSLYQPRRVSTILDGIRSISTRDIVVIALVFLLMLIILVSLIRIRSILKDSRELEAEVAALVEGRLSPSSELLKERIMIMQKQGMGLRAKFTIFMLILVIAVVAVVAVPLSNFIITNQRQILAQGLEDRIGVMLESLATGAAGELNSNNVINIIRGLGQLSNQVSAMEEIEYITITSRSNPNNPGLDQEKREYIWSSNDSLLFALEEDRLAYEENINEDYRSQAYFQRNSTKPVDAPFSAGLFLIQDAVSERIENNVLPAFNANIEDAAIAQLVENLNRIIEQRVGADLQESLNRENELRRRLENELERYIAISSEPEFSVQNYDINSQYYTFFYPVYWYNEEFAARYQGTIRLGISTETINQQIRETQRTIIIQVLIFAAIAIAAGVAGALLLASITVNPIRKLVNGVERIRDTEVKSELKDQPIDIQTGDELNFLSDTINQMTDGLIKAEVANKSVMLGKDVQKMFISLDPSPYDEKTKATTRHEATDFVEFFGYYEGAKGVSGDYFYYQKIDDRTYAMIKCDVSGKDIEAALIMVTVATLFLQHFDGWQEKQLQQRQIAHLLKQTQHQAVLSNLATSINEIIYEREFKGKFAAFNMLTLDERNGAITFCNAGDNVVHVYRRKEHKVVCLELSSTPAAGAISERIMGMPINFPEEEARLEPGDILLLFTDGYEEARRYLRHPDWTIYQESEYEGEDGKKRLEALEQDMAPYIMGQDEGGLGEAFSIERIHKVVEAAMNRRVYTLTKFANPAGDEQLVFDFSAMEPTLPNLLLALMSVEKVFRLVPLPTISGENRISVDKKIDQFLKDYFLQYGSYFHHPLPEDKSSLYQRYSHIAEDSQYDDLTILAVEKK